jgi:hypothetical protein
METAILETISEFGFVLPKFSESSAPRAKPGLSLARLGLHRGKLSTADRHKTCIEHHQ